MKKYEYLSVEKINLWENNPRGVDIHKIGLSDREVIDSFFNTPKKKDEMKKLAEDVILTGFLPTAQPCVWHDVENDKFISIDGNRRILSLKLISEPNLVSHQEDLFKFYTNIPGFDGNTSIFVYITPDYDEAIRIAEKTHLGEDEGRGQKNWVPKEKDFFKDKVKKDPRTKITNSYLIRTNYPTVFEDIVERLRSTSVDRIIGYKMVRNSLGIRDFSILDKAQQKNLLKYLELAENYEKEQGLKLSRFTLKQSKEILNDMKLDESKTATEIPVTISNPTLSIRQQSKDLYTTETIHLSDFVINKSDFTNISYIPLFEKTKYNHDREIVLSGNNPGTYSFQIIGYIGEDEVSSEQLNLLIKANVGSKLIAKNDDHNTLVSKFGFNIQIPNLNNLINEINSASFYTYPEMITLSLRFLVHEAILIAFNSLALTGNFNNLKDALFHFSSQLKKDSVQNSISRELKIEKTKVKSFADNFDVDDIYDMLNHLSHTSTSQISSSRILELAQSEISTLLVYISALLNNNQS